jgi:hypothetical protein
VIAMKPEIGRKGDDADRVRQGGTPAANPMEHLESLAWMLDSSIQLPGTRFRIGLDSLIGLVPVLGDIVGAALSSYILWVASSMGVPRVTLLRMALNVALESAAGIVPGFGDLFDMAWKANKRNVEILKQHRSDPQGARRRDWVFIVLLLAALLAVVALLTWAAFAVGRALLRRF